MTALDGKVALVAGGAGAVGEGIVQGFLDAGATVVVPSRSRERLEALRARVPEAGERLVAVETDIGTIEGAEGLRSQVLTDLGRLDVAVASVGGWWQGAQLSDVDPATWHRVIEANLTTHFVLARTFVPYLATRPGTSYLMVCGDADVHPVAGASLSSITASGVMALFRSLVLENAGTPLRVNLLYLAPVATRGRSASPERITAAEVGKHAAYLASDAARMVAGSVVQLGRRPPYA